MKVYVMVLTWCLSWSPWHPAIAGTIRAGLEHWPILVLGFFYLECVMIFYSLHRLPARWTYTVQPVGKLVWCNVHHHQTQCMVPLPPMETSAQGRGHSCPSITGAGACTWVWGLGIFCLSPTRRYTPGTCWGLHLFCATPLLRFIVLWWAFQSFCHGF